MNPILPDDLAVFLQTVQCGSFSAAARALNVAPKVASKQVARLEAALGVALFTRNTRNLRLTDEGEALRDKARSVLDGLAEMRELAQGADGMRGMIRLTAPAPFGRKYVAAAAIRRWDFPCVCRTRSAICLPGILIWPSAWASWPIRA